LNNAFGDQSHGDKHLFLFTIVGLYKLLLTSISEAIDSTSIFLSPTLTLTMYFLSQEITNSQRVSLIVTFLSVLSFQVLIGIYAGL
jgi:hypothetical protein